MHDDEITSDELDDLIDTAETLHAERAADGTEVRLYVAGAEALRASAHAA